MFSEFGDMGKERDYIASKMTQISPKYKHSNFANSENPNNAFFFHNLRKKK